MDDRIRINIAPGFTTRIKKEEIPKYYQRAKLFLFIEIIFIGFIWLFIISGLLGFDIIPNIRLDGNIFVSILFLSGSITLPIWGGWLTMTPYFYYKYAKKNYEKYKSDKMIKNHVKG